MSEETAPAIAESPAPTDQAAPPAEPPPAEPAPAEAAPPEKPRDPVHRQFAALAKKERALREERARLEAERKAMAATADAERELRELAAKGVDGLDELVKRLGGDPDRWYSERTRRAVARLSGATSATGQAAAPAVAQLPPEVEAKLKALDELQEFRRQIEAREAQREAQSREHQVEQVRATLREQIAAHCASAKLPELEIDGVGDQILAVIEAHAQETYDPSAGTAKLLDVSEAAARVASQLREASTHFIPYLVRTQRAQVLAALGIPDPLTQAAPAAGKTPPRSDARAPVNAPAETAAPMHRSPSGIVRSDKPIFPHGARRG